LACGTQYWLIDYRHARAELDKWRACARRIPNPLLRALALQKLTSEKLNPEAAALFAITAPAGARSQVVKLIVAYQVLYDYLDAVNEQPGSTSLHNGLRLHQALLDAVRPGQPVGDYYQHNSARDDGGYTTRLTRYCQTIITTLPSLPTIATVLEHAALRCGQAQAHNHALAGGDERAFIAWCHQQAPESSYHWWELAAGGISCLGIHALFALAATPNAELEQALATDCVYFPPVCAISALLDSLVDHHSDIGTPNHSFVAHYATSAQAAERFIAITLEAATLQTVLARRRRHNIILSGIVAFYLSSSTVNTGFPEPVARRLAVSAGPIARIMRGVMRIRRHIA
jgi:tetraprenyl-beta-curcumene synthase